jgi:pyrimidine-specific ribonucleoside hydrolase
MNGLSMNQAYAIAALCSMILMATAACTGRAIDPRPAALGAQPFIVDTDMAPDDWLAILYLLGRPDVDVRAITVTGAGEAHCVPGVRHALDLVALAGRPDIPVTCGRETPLRGGNVFPASWRERVDNLFGLSLPENLTPPADKPAADLLIHTVRESTQPVHIVTLGPLTNVAEALEAEPLLVDNIGRITIMGGAVHVPGNVGPSSDIDNDVAEWNIYVDPHAAAIVFRSGAPVTLVPLDATDHAPLTMDFYRRLRRDRGTLVAQFAYRVLSQILDFIRGGTYYFWDPLAAAIAIDENLATYEEQPLVVIEEEGSQSGRTMVHQEGSLIRVAVDADRDRFEMLFLDALNGR